MCIAYTFHENEMFLLLDIRFLLDFFLLQSIKFRILFGFVLKAFIDITIDD